ncbi:MAG: ester cyclase [Chloroflexia bacterium]
MRNESMLENGTDMSVEKNKRIVMRLIDEVWNKNNLQVLDELLDPTYFDYSYVPGNREGFERTLAVMQEAFPGHRTTIEEIVGEGDTIAVCQTLSGTHGGTFRGMSASGKQFEVGGYRFYRVVNGKIVSHRGLIDLPSLLEQLGSR